MNKIILAPLIGGLSLMGGNSLRSNTLENIILQEGRYYIINDDSSYGFKNNGESGINNYTNYSDLVNPFYFSHVEGDIYHIHQGDEYLVRKAFNSSDVFMSSDSEYTREWTISVTEDYYNLSCKVSSNTRRLSFYSLSNSKYFCASSSSSSSYHYSIRLLSLEDSCHDFVEAMKNIQCNDYVNGPSVSEWNNAKEEYLKISEQPILNFLRVTPGEESNLYSIEWALAKYDYIISKYGNSKYDDFISERNNKSKSSSFLFSTIGNNYIVPSFVIGLTVLSITTYFFLRKREED